MKKKHRNDHNHGKNGYVGGNARYSRHRPSKKMGKARASWSTKNRY